MSDAPGKHERAFPNSCPYCGDDNLWPHQSSEDSPGFGEWECRSCLRAFKLSMLGQIARPRGTT
jgi:hypothetical protein